VGRLGRKLLLMARQAGTRCIVVACPLCQLNLDLRQSDAVKAGGDIPATPVLYITQLVGLALGIPAEELGLGALSISADSLLSEISPRPQGEGNIGPIGPMGHIRPMAGSGVLLASDKGGAS
jgi:heterodisulfide reductase subunit B